MKLKKFVGNSFKEALEMVKKELGSDAMILSSKSIKTGPFGFGKDAVEVAAAIDETGNIPSPAKTMSSEVEQILQEIKSLRDEVGFLKETLRPIVPTIRIGKDKKGLFNLLVRQGVDAQLAMILLERSQGSLDSLKNAMRQDLKIQDSLLEEDSGFIFFGPPGVGKTTTMSKVAYILASKRKHINLISLDNSRISSITYMKELSKQLKCQLRVVKRASDLPKIIYKDMKNGPVLIDTPGYEYSGILKDMKDIFPVGSPVKKCFLIDATMDTKSAMKAWQSCDTGMIDSIGFTKLDMAAQHGSLYNLSLLTSCPLSFITTGPDIPGDIRIPTSEFLAGLIIGGA